MNNVFDLETPNEIRNDKRQRIEMCWVAHHLCILTYLHIFDLFKMPNNKALVRNIFCCFA